MLWNAYGEGAMRQGQSFMKHKSFREVWDFVNDYGCSGSQPTSQTLQIRKVCATIGSYIMTTHQSRHAHCLQVAGQNGYDTAFPPASATARRRLTLVSVSNLKSTPTFQPEAPPLHPSWPTTNNYSGNFWDRPYNFHSIK
ncbi:hypothetical protein TNCT_606861 [Trichonephila clavata]|uniref:Uncharacterized protein n=1 Tax=Trichonephila clavata TaxID=2740835 RepID=A0A8X6JF56_TRICU|nr:hypothetical protein TNCT_606861 [Trichonephila clavata]